MIARGIRNNNPLNIRRSKDKWQGMKALQTDAQFCQFETMPYGWRAAFVMLTRTSGMWRRRTGLDCLARWLGIGERVDKFSFT